MLTRETPFEEGCVLAVDKPYRWTSSDVVRKVRFLLKRLGHKRIKVGHAGTLDPLATGLLVVCIGKATKRAEALQGQEKEYIADIELGATTPSYDLEHPVDARYPYEHITEKKLREALASFLGEQEQTPPVYSAKSIDGKRAYEYARRGQEVEMRKAVVIIYEAELLEFAPPRIKVRLRCSKGTYIRSFAHDLGQRLESGAHLTGLRRTRSGDLRIEDACTLEQVEAWLTRD